MEVGLCYAKIPASGEYPLKTCTMFEKYDGTNIHWLWRKSCGFVSFGVRRKRYELTDEGIAQFSMHHYDLHEAVEVFKDKYEINLNRHLEQNFSDSAEQVLLFTEFLGKKSFAGQHEADDEKSLVLFDIEIDGKILGPERFLAFAKEIPSQFGIATARVVYTGKYNGSIEEKVRKGGFNVKEGVVIKGEKQGVVYMAKIKTNDYMKRLKEAFGNDWENYWE